MSARSKNSVSVAPGIRQVTVTPLSLSSCAQREGERIEERLGAVVDRLVGAGHEAGDRAGDQDAAAAAPPHVAADLLQQVDSVPVTLVSITRSACRPKSWSRNALPRPRPALASSASTRPPAARRPAACRRPPSSRDRPAPPRRAPQPWLRDLRPPVRSRARRQRSADRSHARRIRLASSKPMPVEAPVTTAKRSCGAIGHVRLSMAGAVIGLHHDLDAAVLLVAERLVELRAVAPAARGA